MTIVCRVREQAVIAFFLFIFKDMCTTILLSQKLVFADRPSLCTMLFAECVSLRGFLVTGFCFERRKLHWPQVFDL